MGTLVVVTGGSAGLGRALLGRAPEGSRRLDISRSGSDLPGVDHLAADLADPTRWSEVATAIADAIAAHDGDRITVVLNAGVIEPIGPVDRVDPDDYTRSVLLNAAAPQVLGQQVLAALAPHPAARRELVLISSGAARTAYPGWSAYGAAKAATDQWTRAVAAEQEDRERPVRVVSIAPGVVATGMQEAIRATDEADFPAVTRFRSLHEGGQLDDPDEVAVRLWRYLESEDRAAVTDLRDR